MGTKGNGKKEIKGKETKKRKKGKIKELIEKGKGKKERKGKERNGKERK